MKRLMSLCFFVVFLTVLVPVQASAAADILINRVQIGGEKASDEFVELVNLSDTDIDLDGFALRKYTRDSKTGACEDSALVSEAKFFGVIASGQPFVIAHPDTDLAHDLTWSSTSYSLSDNTAIAILDKSEDILDMVGWGDACLSEGKTAGAPDKKEVLTRKHKDDKPVDTGDNHADFEIVKAPELPTPEKSNAPIRINELLPNPLTKGEADEYIELFNFGDAAVNLGGWIVRDASKTGKFTLPADSQLEAGHYLVLPRSLTKLSLNNSNETVSLLEANGALVTSVSFSTTKEAASFGFDTDKKRYRFTKFLTPGEANRFGHEPTSKSKKPQKVYAKVSTIFKASGKDQDGDKLKYTWDFGDGHKSYLKSTKHTYKKKGKYTVTLTVSDGIEDTLTTFKVEAKKYPKHAVKIIEVVPNPSGRDTDNEWLVVKNTSNKKVDLKDWAVATGANPDKLVNHKINKEFTLKPGETLKLTRKDSAFTLNNKIATLVLRSPDGKKMQTLTYSKLDGADDNEAYARTENGWQWLAAADTTSQTTPNNITSTLGTETSEPPMESSIHMAETPSETPAVLGETEDQAIPSQNVSTTSLDIQNTPPKLSSPSLWQHWLATLNSWITRWF